MGHSFFSSSCKLGRFYGWSLEFKGFLSNGKGPGGIYADEIGYARAVSDYI
jgi:hypothetical protein